MKKSSASEWCAPRFFPCALFRYYKLHTKSYWVGSMFIVIGSVDCEQSLFCSKIRAGWTAKSRGRYSSGERRSREPRAASSVGGTSSRLRRSPLKYRPRDFAVHPARILEQKRDCSQSIGSGDKKKKGREFCKPASIVETLSYRACA